MSAYVWDFYPVGGGELLTALKLADHAHHDGTHIYPGIPLLSRTTRQSERTVQYHLSRMRKDKWLLPVRFTHGGRGRATEYRINPIWIENPAEFAPFVERLKQCNQERESVQPAAGNPAKECEKGCNDAAPQLQQSVIHQETTTTDTAKLNMVEVVVVDMEEIPVLCGEARASTLKLIQNCPGDFREQVLAEVAGMSRKGLIHGSAIGLLASLVKAAKAGSFVPNHAVSYYSYLRQKAAEHAQREVINEQVQISGDQREKARAYLETLKSIAGKRIRRNVSSG